MLSSSTGLTLIEVLIYTAVSTALIGMGLGTLYYSQRATIQQENRQQALTELRQVIDSISNQYTQRSLPTVVIPLPPTPTPTAVPGVPSVQFQDIPGLTTFTVPTTGAPCEGLVVNQFIPPSTARTIQYQTLCAPVSSSSGVAQIPFEGNLADLSLGGADNNCGSGHITYFQATITDIDATSGATLSTTTNSRPKLPSTDMADLATWICFRFLPNAASPASISIEGEILFGGAGTTVGKVTLQGYLPVAGQSTNLQIVPKFTSQPAGF